MKIVIKNEEVINGVNRKDSYYEIEGHEGEVNRMIERIRPLRDLILGSEPTTANTA